MKLHIINPYESMAMMRLTAPLLQMNNLYEITSSRAIDLNADINIHAPYHTLVGEQDYGNGKHIALYTHCNPNSEGQLLEACERADIVTAMSFAGRNELLNFGVDPKKVWVTPSAADQFNYRRKAVMICGYPQPNGRKRESILLDLAYKYNLTGYEFIFTGNGWEDFAKKLAGLGVEAKITATLDEKVLTGLYQSVDVLLVTGYLEGGSLPILEAMACGTPLLSPRFGYAADYLDEEDIYDGVDDLMDKLHALFEKGVRYHQIAKAWSWKDYAAEYAMLIGRMTGTSVDLFPDRGVSRYVQLLDLLDEIKPRKICEIGTWNGNRALQLLQTAGKYYPMKRVEYQGFDLFDEQTGEHFRRELSKYAFPVEVVRKRLQATGADIDLVVGDTVDTTKQLKPADFYFVDGGHSDYTVTNDGWAVLHLLDDFGGVAVFDDYYHKGKPDMQGANLFIDNLPPQFEVKHLPARTMTDDGREIGMVKVCRNTSTVTITDTVKNW